MTDPKQPQSVTEIAQRIAKHIDEELVSFSPCPDDFLPPQIEEIRRDGLEQVSDYLAGELRAYRKAVLLDAAFNLWRNGDDVPPLTSLSPKSLQTKDRAYAVAKLRRLAGE